jgi:hypothetical protein
LAVVLAPCLTEELLINALRAEQAFAVPKTNQRLNNTKARTNLIPPILAAAGFPGMSHTRFSEIAAIMRPGKIHPEVRAKLDAIQHAFGL